MSPTNHSITLKTAAVVFMGVALLANFITVMSGNFLNDLVYLEAEQAFYRQNVEGLTTWILPITFAIPSVFILIYLFPLLKRSSPTGPLENLVKRRLLNAPLIVASIGIMGWVTSILFMFYGMWKNEVMGSLYFFFSGITNPLILGGFCFVLSYYLLEALNRRFFIPKIFPEGQLEKCEGAINLSIRARFFIYFFAVNIFPIAMFLKTIFKMVHDLQVDTSLTPIFVAAGVLMLSGVVLTYLVSGSYQAPLVEMKEATGSIRSGHYEINIRVVSKDELGSLGEGINEMSQGLKEKELIKDTFGKMVDPTVRDHLLQGNIALGGEVQSATILFADIRGFTTLSEKIAPDRLVDLLNRYFERMSQCVTQENGLVNKYIGDAILAVFGAPLKQCNHAQDAVNAALKMRQARDHLNEELIRDGLPSIHNGIGIHSGDVLAGNIGSKSRMEYTVIGDTVNIASRLEGLCKVYQKDMILSEATLAELGTQFDADYLEAVQVRGREQAIKIFSL